ncbi:Proteasome Alpha Subunit family member [Ectocarpus siliculosus]|uniref:Proteasome Alpha Subunit family member n=1 Tax=Ectocarpus siliculosus TaxID=2880 RepID=D7G2X4_ECTSI|nr:Proteasome Alpha Subunit family member [Ectocarpus siliculosus]|eukprot:CBJ48831.1 Proteasome Alpha Subunit family member [Ectocarpus siliculosus]
MLLSSVSGARESSKGYDADLTLFSPEGRLYQVEYVMRAVGHYGCPAVGVHGEGCCVVACKRDLPDELVYPDSVTSIFRITDDIYSAATGMTGDVRYQVKRARLQALEYKRQYGSSMPSRLLALAMADAAQVNTQHAALRPMACVSLIISVDDPTGPALFRIEPSGQVFQAWGTAVGRGSAASSDFLEEALKAAASRDGRGNSRQESTSSVGGDEHRTPDKDYFPGVPNPSVMNAEKEDDDGQGRTTSDAPAHEIVGDREGDEISDDDVDADNVDVQGPDEETHRKRGSEAGGKMTEPSDESTPGDGGEIGTGFGVVGEMETVELALQALSKRSQH